ncbi:arginine--tRNA ligase [Mesonia maritima]|uniref:Arginine--tRNA ligase n=1 Tax=Mesonia maritima TaxID=1793873 RepID=A0ABU1K7N6_9FLAO|nr:arginine--tRNA ligase [Mesonia maritima]MDR6301311.1 arginyl-tRNA synthetase [Mesonia maritima]
MNIQEILTQKVKEAVEKLHSVSIEEVEFQATRKEFEGDITVVVFPMLRQVKTNPVALGEAIGNHLKENVAEVANFNVVKGFLNIVLSDAYFLKSFNLIKDDATYGSVKSDENSPKIMVEYSSPNTNKPLHLGHIRNNLLGYSVAEILKAAGNTVYKTQIINDRGIHICKSMLAWQKFGEGETPESTGLKGDKLVGNYYVKFDKEYKTQIEELKKQGVTEDDAKQEAPLLLEAKKMLLQWEAGDEEVVALWKKMNQWVYDGFKETYRELGVDFDKNYYESNTYLLGKEVVNDGLEKGVFYRKDDGSVWIDLTDDGLDEKIVLRADGTAVYMTQDIGTAIQRVKDFDINGMVYTVGNEQDYHFKVLFLILKKLGYEWANHLYHLSYGMVDLPSGKMKSREGTVVDADDLMTEMTQTAKEISEELGKLEGYSKEEKEALYKTIGLGALKYYILKVDPKKRILFNPEESVDFQGNTGPFIQYTYARIQSILRKATFDYQQDIESYKLHEKERELIKQLALYPEIVQQAAAQHSPALIANYTYELVKVFNSFYQNISILGVDDSEEKIFRVQLAKTVANTIKSAFSLLGIDVPEQM